MRAAPAPAGLIADPVALAAELIRCPSVTPAEGGALDLLERELTGVGFTCRRLPFAGGGSARVDNLYARIGSGRPALCFAGHTDVVPPGPETDWTHGPFEGHLADGLLWGRGAADMKGAIAAFAAAAARHLATHGLPAGSIGLLITGDEEGPAVNGTVRMLEWLEAHGEPIDHCLVGEPTNPHTLGDMIKIGRRGSLNGVVTVEGRQGHVAYPHLADNPVPHLVAILAALDAMELDGGTAHFQPSNLEITTIDVRNEATNVIPARATARFNIRFNDAHTGAGLTERLEELVASIAAARSARATVEITVSGESFVTRPGPFVELVAAAVETVTGRRPKLSTTGGTSDARFIRRLCPVVEFGLVGETMHKADERVAVADVAALADIYVAILAGYFSDPARFAPGAAAGEPRSR